MIYVLLLVPLRGIWPLVVAWRARPAARHRQCTDAAVPALHASQPSSTELVRTPRPSISTSKMSLHEHGWLTRSSDPTRRAGDDYITSLQTHRDTHHFNQRWTISQVRFDQRVGVAEGPLTGRVSAPGRFTCGIL
jgi:hypothetical protein